MKKKDKSPILDFDHKTNKSMILQNVEIRLNNRGLRGQDIPKKIAHRRILFLGSSITLGWGVEEEQTTTSIVQKMFKDNGKTVEVINGGCGFLFDLDCFVLFTAKVLSLYNSKLLITFFFSLKFFDK